MTEVSLHLEALTRRFGKRVVFEDVCAHVQRGKVLAIAGANGSGKSTLLRIIAGLLSPSQGTVQATLASKPLTLVQRRRAVGYVAPDLTLYAELSAVENLQLFANLRGYALSRDDLIAALERVQLLGRGRDLVGDYSSGMRQRLKYAFALLHDPPILLLDEPTANLDERGMEMVAQVVQDQRQRGLTVVASNETREVEWGDAVIRLGA